MEQITLFYKGDKVKRYEFVWVNDNDKYLRKLFVYDRVGNKWVEKKVYSTIDRKKLELLMDN
ncbi:MAG: hypothetical protein KAG64_05785 [Bacteroidales bacterium]|nr:hypothetical protein [Bacteroidales bacterium]